jgi:hypothetical protein
VSVQKSDLVVISPFQSNNEANLQLYSLATSTTTKFFRTHALHFAAAPFTAQNLNL